jgi:hypothetical protein
MSDCGPYARGERAALVVVAPPPAAPTAEVRSLVLPGVGRLEPRETVHLLRDGDRLIGFLLADDADSELCVIALAVDFDDAGWRATVDRVVCRAGGSDAARGSTFRIASR